MCVDKLDAEALLELADMMGYDGDDDEGAIEFVAELADSGEPEAMKSLGIPDDGKKSPCSSEHGNSFTYQ